MSRLKLAEIYENKVLVEMDSEGILGASSTSGGNLENADEYAPNRNEIPYIMGNIQSRTGKINSKKSKKSKKLAQKLRPNKL